MINLKSFTIRNKNSNEVLIKLYFNKKKKVNEIIIQDSLKKELIISGVDKDNKKVYFS